MKNQNRTFKDNDDVLITLDEIEMLNETAGKMAIFDRNDMAKIKTMLPGERLTVDMGEWLERIE